MTMVVLIVFFMVKVIRFGKQVMKGLQKTDYLDDLNELQDSLTIKPPKKASLVLRLMLSAFAMVCGIYICSICLKQMNLQNKNKFLFFEDFERPCYDTVVDRSQIPYLHYPKPKTFNR